VKLESLILTFATNASWQLLVLAASARAARGLIARLSPRLQCRFWSATLAAAVVLPAVGAAMAVSGRESTLKTLQLRPDTLQKWSVVFGVLIAVSALVTARRWLATRRILQAMPESSERIRIVAARCAEALGTAPASVRISNTIASPVTLGARRPVIVLPRHLDADASEDVLTTALGHELAHIRRRDFAWSVLQEIVTVPIAWHPAARWFKRNIAAARELACDDLVAGHLVDRRVYAESLLSLARTAITGRTPRGALGVLDGGNLEARIDRLMCRNSFRRRSAWAACTFLMLIAIAVGCERFSVLIDRCYLHPAAATTQAIDLCLRFPWLSLG
jgi:beta-lactamase regulating signal transducer with metallopeptidase domain